MINGGIDTSVISKDPVLMIDDKATEDDKKVTLEIVKLLREDYNQYESEADTRKREEILGKLKDIIKTWIREVDAIDKKDEDTILNSGGKIFAFGSYKLGVHSPNSDIDVLVVGPRHVDPAKHFFEILANKRSYI